MRILITGATGFIGSHLMRLLAGTDHEVVCLVRGSGGVSKAAKLGARPHRGDVTDRDSVAAGLKGCDCVVHLANIYSMWEPDKSDFQRVNVGGTRTVLECALEAGAGKVIHVSTAGTYGVPADRPFTEESRVGPVRFSEYARTKYAGELFAWDLFKEKGLPLVVLSPGAVLGPGDTKPTGRYIEDLAARRMPVGVCRDVVMTYVHVKDVAQAILLAIEKEDVIGEKYLIGSEPLSFGELTDMICDAAGVPAPKIFLTGPVVTAAAAFFTAAAAVTKRPPPWGFSLDQASMARHGFEFDGSKAERELGLRYAPVRSAVEEALASIRR